MSTSLVPAEGYCQCGCGEKTKIATKTDRQAGQVRGEPLRYVLGHNGRRDPIERFWAAVEKTNDCWLWRRRLTPGGYGQLPINGLPHLAHRFAYELLVGPIPAGLTIDHLCRKRACVNPDHLEPVSMRENVLRGIGITAENVRKTHCPYGHEYVGDNLAITPEGARRCRACSRLRSAKYKAKFPRKPKGKLSHDAIREILASDETHTALGERFGVSFQAIAYHRKKAAA